MLRVSGARVNITDRWTLCSAASLPIPVVFILVNGFVPQDLAKSKIQLTWIVKSPPEKTPPLPAVGQGSPASCLCACCSQGKVSPHSAGPVTGSLCWGSHLSRGSQLSCDRETKNRERGQWRLYSHTVFPASGREIHHKPRKNEATNSREVLLPSYRCGKAGDYMAELKTKVILLKSHLRGQEELILCNLLIWTTFHESTEFCNFQSGKFKALYYIINHQVFRPPTWDCFLALKIIYLKKSFLFQEHTRNQKAEHKTWATSPHLHFNILPMPSPL